MIRQFYSQDAYGGVPTCARCMQTFSTFSSLAYHVQYVCMDQRQDLTDLEHRLRVQEALQYARARQLEALANDAPLLAYFHTRCAICAQFCTTVQGLLLHWKSVHTELFVQHEPINDELLTHVIPNNPSAFCGHHFKRYHICHVLRQVALLLVADGYQSTNPVPADLTCHICGKAYTTRHGLQQHMQIYHEAEQACHEMDEATFEAHCLTFEAIQTGRIEDLLGSEAVQFFLATQCLSCQRQFSRKQDLKRHMKHNHGSEWNECERRAMLLDAQYKPTFGCLCHPPSHQKHICNLYLQYALLRIDHERQLMPQVMALPPDMILSVADQIEPVLWLGYPQFLYRKTELRTQLMTQCQICGWAGNSAAELHVHLHALHASSIQEVQGLKELFQWCMFGELGCFCLPSVGWGDPNHECVGLLQMAILAKDFQWPVIVPWSFDSTDLVTLLGDLLPRAALQTIGMDLMTRNFHRIWTNRDLIAMLSSRCLICQEAVPLRHLKAHLFVAHRIDSRRVQCITQQLSWVYADLLISDSHCDWCGEVLPSYFTDDDEILDPVEHLCTCSFVIQVALLLMMPKWSRPTFTPGTWPSQEEISAGFRQLDLKLWQFNAQPSDTFGADLDHLARCGLDFIQDAWIADKLSYQCLLCHKSFFLPKQFAQHLHEQHNFRQLHTLMCLHRLQLTCDTPCQYCQLERHDIHCLPLLNLAVFLLHGYGVRGAGWARSGTWSVGQPAQQGATPFAGHLSLTGSGDQEAQAQWSQREADTVKEEPGHGAGAQTGVEHNGSLGVETRRRTQHSAPRGRVCPPHVSRTGLSATGTSPAEPTVATKREETLPSPHTGTADDAGSQGPTREVDAGRANNGPVDRVRQVPPHLSGWGENHAVPSMESHEEGVGAECVHDGATCPTGTPLLEQHPADPGSGCRSHLEIPCPAEDGAWTDPYFSHTMVVDDVGTTGRPMGRAEAAVLSLYLASHTCPTSATITAAAATGQTVDADLRGVNAVRILLNTSGTMCFVNSVVQCLAWMMLLADGFHRDQWRFGFELMRNVTLYSFVPLDLLRHQPFLWLMIGVGVLTEASLQRQQDVREFCTALLNLLQPSFVNVDG